MMEPVGRPLDFASVYAAHAPFVRRQLMRRGVRAEDLEDALQESFVTIHRLLPSFEGRSSLETWLASVVWRVAASYHRRRGRLEPSAAASDGSIADGPPQPSIEEGLHASLALLDEENRDVLALHDIGGMSISELADITGNARATIRQRLERARIALGRRMWRTLTDGHQHQEAWLKQLSPRLAGRLESGVPLSVQREIVVSGTNAISTLGDVAMIVWRGPQTATDMEVLLEIVMGLSAASPDGITYLSVVEPSSMPPGREARQMMAWGAGKLGAHMRAAGWAIEDNAMLARVAPLMNACMFLGGVPINARFFEGVAPAASWLAQHGPVTAPQISAQVEAMKRRLNS